MRIPQKLYGVIGWPLAQSLSPLIHNTGFGIHKIAAVYMAWPLPESSLEQFVRAMQIFNVAGCSITIPHKVAVLPLLDNISEAASLAGAANTLYWRDGLLYGGNTDVEGFLSPLQSFDLDKMDALLLGAGGAARAAAAALRLRGCRHVRVASPGNSRQYELAERFGFEAIAWGDRYNHPARLIINATPMGMHGSLVAQTPYNFAEAPEAGAGVAYDLVYNPLRTVFLQQARGAGRQIISGVEMFYGQGNAQFQLWTGLPLPAQARAALDQALATEEGRQ